MPQFFISNWFSIFLFYLRRRSKKIYIFCNSKPNKDLDTVLNVKWDRVTLTDLEKCKLAYNKQTSVSVEKYLYNYV